MKNEQKKTLVISLAKLERIYYSDTIFKRDEKYFSFKSTENTPCITCEAWPLCKIKFTDRCKKEMNFMMGLCCSLDRIVPWFVYPVLVKPSKDSEIFDTDEYDKLEVV